MTASRERCSTCGRPIHVHTFDDAVACNKAGYWLFLLKKAIREGAAKEEKTDAKEAEA